MQRKLSSLGSKIVGRLLDEDIWTNDVIVCPITEQRYSIQFEPNLQAHYCVAGGFTYVETLDDNQRTFVRILDKKGVEIAYTYCDNSALVL